MGLAVHLPHSGRAGILLLVIINRTSRYQNPWFPWKEIVQHYGSRIIFVGLHHEYTAFIKEYGIVSYRETSDFLELARLIAGSRLFIGNQSSANAIAEGLKHNLIQETCLHITDCIFKRDNAQHVFDGECILPSVSGSGELHIPSKVGTMVMINQKKDTCPPGMWQMNGKSHSFLGALVETIWKDEGMVRRKEDVEASIIEHNVERLPEYFKDNAYKFTFDTFHKAYVNASE
jgi:hypothetical protein